MKPKVTDDRVFVSRHGIEWEVIIGWRGTAYPATHRDPPEYPEPYIAFAWRDGAAMADPLDVPEDVMLEAVAIDSETVPNEPDEPDHDEERWERRLFE